MKIFLIAALTLVSSGVLAAETVHCSVEKYVSGNGTLNTVVCGDVDFIYPDPIKGAIETSKGVGACPELAMGLFRAHPNLSSISFDMGFYDPHYGTPGKSGNFAFTQQHAGAVFYKDLPQKFALDFSGVQGPDGSYRARCELK